MHRTFNKNFKTERMTRIQSDDYEVPQTLGRINVKC